MFMMHLVIEKSLKASWILDNNKAFPPKTHNLLRLAAEIKTNLKEEQKLLLFDMNDFNLEARYPDFKLTFKKRCNRAFAQGYFAQAEELYRWLSTQK
jgi:HEPN domain-containing protein